jgi:outer membrane lipoprotein carrier protein
LQKEESLNAIAKWIVCWLFCSLAAVAMAAETEEIIKAIEAKYTDVSVMQADFTQTTRSALFGAEQQRGDVTLKRPSMMRWNFTNEKQFVTDGKTMWIYTRADNQVIKYDDISTSTSTADSLLQSLDKLSEIFKVEVEPGDSGQHILLLLPNGKNSQFKKIRLTMSADFSVDHVVVTDAFENVTELKFTNMKLNGQVEDSSFQFDIPTGAEVITAGSM